MQTSRMSEITKVVLVSAAFGGTLQIKGRNQMLKNLAIVGSGVVRCSRLLQGANAIGSSRGHLVVDCIEVKLLGDRVAGSSFSRCHGPHMALVSIAIRRGAAVVCFDHATSSGSVVRESPRWPKSARRGCSLWLSLAFQTTCGSILRETKTADIKNCIGTWQLGKLGVLAAVLASIAAVRRPTIREKDAQAQLLSSSTLSFLPTIASKQLPIIKMQYLTIALFAGLAAAQSLPIPARNGNVQVLSSVMRIPAGVTRNFNYQEFDRGMACRDGDTGTANAVFVLENGATLENVIIGANALEGVHCEGACTVRNVWFRDVCEDAVSALGNGNVLIVGGGAQNADDKVVQHNGSGRVTIRNYQVLNVGKLYRACGDCTNNSSRGPRHVTIEGLRATNVRTNLAGINFNYGDTATISTSCGTVSGEICQQFEGVNKSENRNSDEVAGKTSCLGAQGKLVRGTMPRCS
ncbi:hypothetical protein OPT61_g1445 [Boeremia exigua]|uniref:Uncharacterized protein n=1 Tax=Boeremia exigua TaxID=749465 RepID=A0ACC2IQB3_9PLEO|nr:hypothetical protein OPT61_g1445 [Boeremia exigua]